MPENRRVFLIGAGGHARAVAGSVLALADAGFGALAGVVGREDEPLDAFDVPMGEGAPLRLPIVRGDAAFRAAHPPAGDTALLVGIGIRPGRADPGVAARRRAYEAYRREGYDLPALIDPSAVFRGRAAAGAQVMAGAVVQTGAAIGENAVVNTGVRVDHDCRIGDHVFLGPGAVLCGDVRIGAGALVGAGATVLPGVAVAAGAVVRAGTVVARDLAAAPA